MKQNNILLSRYSGKRPLRAYNGRSLSCATTCAGVQMYLKLPVATLRLSVLPSAWIGCDCEPTSFVVTTDGISGEMICDLMIQSVEHRFGSLEGVPHRIEWLSDNGSCYTAKQTRDFVGQMGLVFCTMQVSSSERIGMTENFIKTFKRDYVSTHHRPDDKTIMTLLPHQFNECNDVHPYKGLNTLSPEEFIRSNLNQLTCRFGRGNSIKPKIEIDLKD